MKAGHRRPARGDGAPAEHGADHPTDPADHRLHARFLETWDESFDYGLEQPPGQGRWQIHGLGLPDAVLSKVHAANARRIIRFD